MEDNALSDFQLRRPIYILLGRQICIWGKKGHYHFKDERGISVKRFRNRC